MSTQRSPGFVLLTAVTMRDAITRVSAVTSVRCDAKSTSDAPCQTACYHQTFKTTVFTASDILAKAPTVPASPRRTISAWSTSDVVVEHATSPDIYLTKDSRTWTKIRYVKHTISRMFGVPTQIADDRRRRERGGTVPSMNARLEDVQRREETLEVLTAINVRYTTNFEPCAFANQPDRSLQKGRMPQPSSQRLRHRHRSVLPETYLQSPILSTKYYHTQRLPL